MSTHGKKVTHEDTIQKLGQLGTPKGILDLLLKESTSLQHADLVLLADKDDDTSIRLAAFLSFYTIVRNKGHDAGLAFEAAWQQSLVMEMIEQDHLARYAAWAAYYEAGDLTIKRCQRCKALYACSASSPFDACPSHR
jgi:hypothetical protein